MIIKETYYVHQSPSGRYYIDANGYEVNDRALARRFATEQEAFDEAVYGEDNEAKVVKITTTVTIEETTEVL